MNSEAHHRIGPRSGALLALFLLAACSMTRPENRRTLHALDASAAPDSAGARWAAAPLAFPAGLLALALDAVIVHPACSVDDAWGDTRAWLWTPDPEASRFRRAMLLPLAALATPFVWAGDWIGRILLPIPARQADEVEEASS